MTKLPSMPLYVDDYEADTAHLTPEEDGIYNRLMRLCWRSPNCMVPDDQTWLMRKLRVGQECWDRSCVAVIEEFFSRQSGKIFQKRQREEYMHVSAMVDARKASGSKGGRAKSRKSKYLDASNTTYLPEANDKQTNAFALATTTTTTTTSSYPSDTQKEEEGAREISGLKEEPPDPFLNRVVEAVGLADSSLPRFWIGQSAADHVKAWITAHGLTEDEVVAEVAKSRTKNADPPHGPKALDRWMAQAGAAKQSAGTIKATKTTDTPAKAPVSPEDRLQFFAKWVKDTSQYMAPSTISNTLRDALLSQKMVTVEDLRVRGIR